MKNSSPSLILYFFSCTFFVIFSYLQDQNMILLSKSIILPCIFVYYLIENNYKFDLIKLFILFFCFAGDVVILLDLKFSLIYSVYAFLIVYLLLFKFVWKDFKTINFIKKDINYFCFNFSVSSSFLF